MKKRSIIVLVTMVLACTINAQKKQTVGKDRTYIINNEKIPGIHPLGLTDINALPVLRENMRFEMQSSYDRTGGNDDGFNGTYSVLRKENGNSVIAETEGQGMITRIWFPYNAGYPAGPMSLIGKRIFIYLDGKSTPEIELPIIELFNNTNKNFPYPLSGMDLGGCWSHLPIPFNKGAKIVVEGENVGFFQVQFTKFKKEEQMETFSYEKNPIIANRTEIMEPLWNTGDIDGLKINNPVVKEELIALKAGNNELQFIDGPAILKAFIVEGNATELAEFMNGRLIISWDDQKHSAVDVPLSMFFIQENTGTHSRSLMAGLLPGGQGVYNVFPMPYQGRAKVKLIMPKECKVNIKLVFDKLTSKYTNLGYLNIHHNIDNPTTPGKKHTWLDVKGTGHYVGVYMRAKGESLSDDYSGKIYWTGCLEGDEIFEVDGKMVAHGTGTEDYFNAGWNGMYGRLDHAKSFPFHGYTLFDASKKISRTAAYRWHLPTEVIPFENHFKATIEVGPEDQNVGDYESIVYYYLKFKK